MLCISMFRVDSLVRSKVSKVFYPVAAGSSIINYWDNTNSLRKYNPNSNKYCTESGTLTH